MFLSNQEEILNSIEIQIKQGNTRFIIYGDSGTGKSFLIDRIKNNLECNKKYEKFFPITLSGDKCFEDRDYYMFYKYFSTCDRFKYNHKKKIKDISKKAAKAIPYAGDLSELLVEQLFTVNESKFEECNKIFSQEEVDILFKLKHILSTNCKYMFIDNLQWWDKKSLVFLNILLKSCDFNESLSFLKDTIFIINITTNQISSNSEAINSLIETCCFQQFNLNIVSKEDYPTVLQYFGLKHEIIGKLMDVLYSISNGHLQLTKNIVKYLNDTDIDDLIENPSTLHDSFLDKLIEQKLSEYGAKGDLIKNVLKYASIIGKSFTFRELEKMTSKNRYELSDLIDNANKLYLVEKGASSGEFVHEIVREIFYGKTENEKFQYYGAFADCLKYIKPGDYKARLACYLKVGLGPDSELICVLEYIKKIRCKEFIDLGFQNQIDVLISDSKTKEYLEFMKIAYDNYFTKRYDQAISMLNQIDDTYNKLYRAERDYLLSICLSKKLDKDSRELSVKCLEQYVDIDEVYNEGEIWTRVLLALLVAYVHINKPLEALCIEKKLMNYLSERADYDVEARDKINILRRKASAIHDSDKAAILTQKSVEYFGSNGNDEPWNPIEYFMALTNHVGNLIVSGMFEDAYEYACDLAKQVKSPNKVLFTRIEVALNNYVLSAVLSGKLSVGKSLNIMNVIVSHSRIYADYVLLELNRANLLAMNNNILEASELLESIYQKLHEGDNVEAYYEFCINSNRMIMAHLLGHKEKALNILKLCNDTIPNIGDQHYYKKRNNLIEQLIENDIVSDGFSWLNIIFEKFDLSKNNTMWKFYGLGYLFTDMAYWSES